MLFTSYLGCHGKKEWKCHGQPGKCTWYTFGNDRNVWIKPFNRKFMFDSTFCVIYLVFLCCGRNSRLLQPLSKAGLFWLRLCSMKTHRVQVFTWFMVSCLNHIHLCYYPKKNRSNKSWFCTVFDHYSTLKTAFAKE